MAAGFVFLRSKVKVLLLCERPRLADVAKRQLLGDQLLGAGLDVFLAFRRKSGNHLLQGSCHFLVLL